jgi:hypothetical protein
MVPLACGWTAFCDSIAQMHIHSWRMIICFLARVPLDSIRSLSSFLDLR